MSGNKDKVVSKENLTRYHNKLKTYIVEVAGNGSGSSTPEPIRSLADDVMCGDSSTPVYIENGEFKECELLSAASSTKSGRAEYAAKLANFDATSGKTVEVNPISTNKVCHTYFEDGVPKELNIMVPVYTVAGTMQSPLSNCDTCCIVTSTVQIPLPKLTPPEEHTCATRFYTIINNSDGTPLVCAAVSGVRIYNREGKLVESVGLAANSCMVMAVIVLGNMTIYKVL